MGASSLTGQADEWRLRAVGNNLGSAIGIGMIVIIGILSEALQILVRPWCWGEVLRCRQDPKLALCDWDIDGYTEDVS